MDRPAAAAVFDGRDAPARLSDRPDATHAHAHAMQTTQPTTTTTATTATPLDILSSASSFQSNSSYARQPLDSLSQETTTSSAPTSAAADADIRMHTPPEQQQQHDYSSQESQLLQLSTLAATRERMADAGPEAAGSRKRTADGTVKQHARTQSSASPYVGGHSRNTSTVSVASTGSRIGELSAELKARLSYAMVKVTNGWQAHSIDQVENLASQAASPTSSTSTLHGHGHGHGRQAGSASVSPRLPGMPPAHKRQQSQASVSSVSIAIAPASTTTPAAAIVPPPRVLAPPAAIQAARPRTLARRRSDTTSAAAYAHSHGTSTGPHTPGEPMLFSPDQQNQNVREQDAIETLLFMSSPGNSANMKHFPSFASATGHANANANVNGSSASASASQPLPSGHHDAHQRLPPLATTTTTSPQRHALPTVARRALPNPQVYPGGSVPPSLSPRRPGAPGTPAGPGHRRNQSDMMDMDDAYLSRSAKGTPRRRAGTASFNNHNHLVSPRLKVPLSMPSGLSVPSKPRPLLAEEDIDRLLDRAAAADDDSSDSDSEILIPARPTGVGM